MTGENFSVAIACGGTGGHLFPGLSVAERLRSHGCEVALFVSPKQVDQEAARSIAGMRVVTLPAAGFQQGSRIAFLRGLRRSYAVAKNLFAERPPDAALAMGGFTSLAPILAAKKFKAASFLHESNTVPGRANCWLSRLVDHAFTGFPSAAASLRARQVTVTGTPVRPEFKPRDAAACRAALGFDPARPLVLVIGGSQGAGAINELVARSLPLVKKSVPDWQWLHLAGPRDAAKMTEAYAAQGITAKVHSFSSQMELVLGAANAAVSRAGASSLSEFAAMRLPAVLVPYPAATGDHQLHNARYFAREGAARLLEQREANPELLVRMLMDLVLSWTTRELMQKALESCQAPHAADHIAEIILHAVRARSPARSPEPVSLTSASPPLPASANGLPEEVAV